ncbi:MAG: hypothetical protein PUE83_09755 [Lachnobacterium sp.]|nr:hypothetical protein [Lachnobacterium sp.]
MLPELKYTKALLNRKEVLKKRLHSNKVNSEQAQHIKAEISSIDDKVASLIKDLTPFINTIEDKQRQDFIRNYFLKNKSITVAEVDANSYYAPQSLYRETMRFLKSI